MRLAKEAVHDVVQKNLNADEALQGSVLVKWVLVLEAAMADGSHSVIRMTSDADGHDLYKWETIGLLQTALGDK